MSSYNENLDGAFRCLASELTCWEEECDRCVGRYGRVALAPGPGDESSAYYCWEHAWERAAPATTALAIRSSEALNTWRVVIYDLERVEIGDLYISAQSSGGQEADEIISKLRDDVLQKAVALLNRSDQRVRNAG